MTKRRGLSYRKRVEDINRIYDRYARLGLSNREIWRRHIYPVYCISERTLYSILKAATKFEDTAVASDMPSLFDQLSDQSEEMQKP